MTDIQHRIHIAAPNQTVYEALSSIEGLSQWWTSTTEGTCAPGEAIDFRFGEHVTTMRVETMEPERVVWRCEKSNPDWEGTRVTFDLRSEGEGTVLTFGHRGWQEANDFFGHCSMKWATFLLSLRELAEGREGSPFPRDVSI